LTVEVVVDAGHSMGEFVRLWASVGFDEINWSYTTRGARLLRTLGQIDETPYLVRCHNMFTSGTAMGLPHPCLSR
jgi:xylan 1,4-beta-xylosidase